MYNFIIHHKRIREARYDHGLSVSELGLVAGLTDEQVIGLENEKINNCFVEYDHRIDCVRRVADALGIDYDHFLQNLSRCFAQFFLASEFSWSSATSFLSN